MGEYCSHTSLVPIVRQHLSRIWENSVLDSSIPKKKYSKTESFQPHPCKQRCLHHRLDLPRRLQRRLLLRRCHSEYRWQALLQQQFWRVHLAGLVATGMSKLLLCGQQGDGPGETSSETSASKRTSHEGCAHAHTHLMVKASLQQRSSAV